jgi:hypothetical protein
MLSGALGVAALNTGGGGPSPGYLFLRGKQGDGSYVTLTGLNANASRSNLQGKAS